ncbi:hypothetical protein HK105_207471 [Polyrhizophydium stewartii]|uniref:Palmitoyltransferase n=1 Tax=Polyrhizophydium stewartii TaxID=2732419 RepID=A0ABR4N0H3_9FUNG
MRIWWRSPQTLLKAGSSALNLCLLGLGPLLIMLAMSLFGLVGLVFFTAVLPDWFPPLSTEQLDLGRKEPVATTLLRLLHGALAVYLLVCVVFHYSAAVLVDPGRTHDGLVEQLLGEGDDGSGGGGSSSFGLPVCSKCNMPKPQRAHHCSVCRRWTTTVLGIHNCVGLFNHRYFFLFLVYLTIGETYFTVMASPLAHRKFWLKSDPATGDDVLFLFAFLIAAALLPFIAAFMWWHGWLIAKNQTQIEQLIQQGPGIKFDTDGQPLINEYDLGTRRNFEDFFNISRQNPWWTVLIPRLAPPRSDGVYYTTVRDLGATPLSSSIIGSAAL